MRRGQSWFVARGFSDGLTCMFYRVLLFGCFHVANPCCHQSSWWCICWHGAFLAYRDFICSPAMTPTEIDLVVRRLMVVQAPKESQLHSENLLCAATCLTNCSFQLSLTEDFTLLVLLCSWMPYKYDEDGWDLLDYFCGVGKVGTLALKAGYQAALFDLNFEPAPTERSTSQRKSKRPARSKFDCNGEVGFSFPGHIH